LLWKAGWIKAVCRQVRGNDTGLFRFYYTIGLFTCDNYQVFHIPSVLIFVFFMVAAWHGRAALLQ